MENYIELSYSDITNIMLNTRIFSVEQSGANVILAHSSRVFSVEFTLHGVVSDSEDVYVCAVEGDEECPAIRCTVCDENEGSESMYPERISGWLKFWNYLPYEGKSATVLDILEHGVSAVGEKHRSLGDKFLNDEEKKLYSEIDFLTLILYPEWVGVSGKEDFSKVRALVDGTTLAEAIDRYMKEDMGLPGRKNLAGLVKEAKRFYEKEFDHDKYVCLIKEAAGIYPFNAGKEALNKYENFKKRVSDIMKNAGYTGEYPCFEIGEKYVDFGADIFGDEIVFLYSRFGIKGEKPKKYFNKAVSDDRLIMPPSNFENDAQISVYTDGLFAVLEGKRPTKDFEEIVLGGHIKSPAGRFFGVLCIILALCLAAVIIACGMKNVVPGFGASLLLLGFGLYMSFSKGKVHVLKADKGDRI